MAAVNSRGLRLFLSFLVQRFSLAAFLILPDVTFAAAQVQDALFYSLFDPGTAAQFNTQQGSSVAVDGNIAVAGAPTDNVGGYSSGVVKVYDATSGALLHTLTNPAPASDDYFGICVAVSGTRVVVGAHGDDAGKTDAGSAYVFDLSSFTPTLPVLTLTNLNPAGSLFFGWDVAISGTRVVVGVPWDNTGAPQSGIAYVYDLASAVPTTPIVTLANPSPAQDDSFGKDVAISGTRVVVGATGDDTGMVGAGSAYVYDLASSTPSTPMITLTNPSPAYFDYFANAVAISGTRVVIGAADDDTGADGAGSVYVYDLASSIPTVPVITLTNPNPATSFAFGYTVAVSGTRVAVGVPYESTEAEWSGRTYVYDLAGAVPTIPAAVILNPTVKDYDKFGWDVAISGTRMVVGAPNDDTTQGGAGSAYAYDLAGPHPTTPVATLSSPSPSTLDNFGYSVALSGTRLVVGAYADDSTRTDAGGAYVYDLASSTPTVPFLALTNPVPTNAYFGWSVAISGTRVIVGSSDTSAGAVGNAYVYDLSSAMPAVPVLTLTNPRPAPADHFGWALAISGTRLVVGDEGDDTGDINAGSAYVYDLAGATPTTPIFTLNNPSPAHSDRFGNAVAISGTRVVVGAYEDDAGTNDAGSAYIYDLASVTPTVPVATLTNPAPAQFDSFGHSVAISGARVVVGAYRDKVGTNEAGTAYVYDLTGATPTVPILTLTNPTPAQYDGFGYSVAISGTRVMVGAIGGDVGATNAGNVYVYDLASATPAHPTTTLINPGRGGGDSFGNSIAFDNGITVVGAPDNDTAAQGRGAAYVFSAPPVLRIVPEASGFATLSWTLGSLPRFVLQYTESLAQTNWVNAPSGAANPVTITTTNEARFYRLLRR